MTHNPYAPPAAPVADVAPSFPATEMSGHVRTACKLMWCAYGTGLADACVQLFSGQLSGPVLLGGVIGALIGGSIGFLIVWWGTSKLKAGRNWMRLLITFVNALAVVLTLLALNYVLSFYTLQYGTPVRAALAAAQWILNLSAVVLINTPAAREWFAGRKALTRSGA